MLAPPQAAANCRAFQGLILTLISMAASDPASAGKAGLTVRDTAADNLIQDGRGSIVSHAFLASGNKSRHTCRLRAGCANISALLIVFTITTLICCRGTRCPQALPSSTRPRHPCSPSLLSTKPDTGSSRLFTQIKLLVGVNGPIKLSHFRLDGRFYFNAWRCMT